MHKKYVLKTDSGPDGPGWVDARIAKAVDILLGRLGAANEAFDAARLETEDLGTR